MDPYFLKYCLYLVLAIIHWSHDILPASYMYLGFTYLIIFIISMYAWKKKKKKKT